MRNYTQDCPACLARDCQCECVTCARARERRSALVDPPSPAISTDDDQHDPLCSEGEYRGDQRLDCDCSRTGHPSVTSRPDQAATEIEATNDGNTYVFCDHVERVDFSDHRGCVRGAGHNGPHVFQQRNVGSPMLMPVVLQVGSVSVSAQRSEPANAQERSAKENHQTTPDPAIEQAKKQLRLAMNDLTYCPAEGMAERAWAHAERCVDALINAVQQSSTSRLQEADNHHNAATCPYCRPDLEKQKLRLQEVEAERDQARLAGAREALTLLRGELLDEDAIAQLDKILVDLSDGRSAFIGGNS